jgi:glycosyltransferase involved in cell wall biosynthesis
VRIALLDRGLAFDGASLREGPLGGAESAFVQLAEALAARGHVVTAFTAEARPSVLHGVEWRSLDDAPSSCDLAIASRIPALLGLCPRARQKVLWLHNPAAYLRKPRHLLPLLRWRPQLVTLGSYHASTVPWFAPRRALHRIPLAVDPLFAADRERPPPPPVAIFTSNPERGLDRLVDLWKRSIRPAAPTAELHIYAGAATYGGRNAARIDAALAEARTAAPFGVRIFAPLDKAQLREKLFAARLMAYGGDLGETFCLAAAEAQAAAVPVVTAGLGALGERVVDGVSGYIAAVEDVFAARVLQVLLDDDVWLTLHRNCLTAAPRPDWNEIAERFAALAGFG